MKIKAYIIFLSSFLFVSVFSAYGQYPELKTDLDRKVYAFLQEQVGHWRDMNISVADGRLLYNLVLEGNYKQALEIGTSTGHSAIWIAWALSKTGGKLITIEIDKKRYVKALANFKKSGLSNYVDARLGDAHDLVPQLEGPFDFVFCDADRLWYKTYFMTLEPKILTGGCFIAHNVKMRSPEIKSFVEYISSRENFNTIVDNRSRSGISRSYKK